MPPEFVARCREQFPALRRLMHGREIVYFDGPAGTQVPQSVADAVSDYLLRHNANTHGAFATSRETDALMDDAHAAVADLLGANYSDLIAFGANMTSLTFALSRALARTWEPGDEVIVSHLDHDANFSPWVLAAQDAGAIVKEIGVNVEDCTLDMDDFRSKLSSKTKLVAVGCASNAVGSINPVAEITRLAHEVGALVFLDAVHYSPHAPIDVSDWGCDFLACSAYKFFGPHVGILYGKRMLMETLRPYKLRPAPENLPGRWMTGTQNFEGIAGVVAAIEYISQIAGGSGTRRDQLQASYAKIVAYEQTLSAQMLNGLAAIPEVKVYGITDTKRLGERLPTFSIRHQALPPKRLAQYLGEQGVFAWHGNYYALPLTEVLGLEPEGAVRLGMVHYNTPDEVTRVLDLLRELK
ncbi:cysteine desulfurase-like protein [Blastopirellula sp. JC732]|uniref:Cysteine desulfurase-like protein n=1 Tax=Blastopirellula sediminis TaxID=2894196 RepID=A0A9X1MP24_9BACT|nr:cysteine desulfurase-like protein [Blastopirellula sediminis]MCC9605843.1 cysteine desulfurase-like protein [Blastopirellula sediminis]MCC9630858.1 cysteine desulfurase-like protein [Blastopirellula sediminis]